MTSKKTFLCSCLVVILFSTLLAAQKRNSQKAGQRHSRQGAYRA